MLSPDLAIRAAGLSKRYRIASARSDTLREQLAGALRGLVRGQRARTHPFWALRDVSFQVRTGEVLGILGRNGAGKSTLLKILARVTEPTTGSCEMRGRTGTLLEVGTGFHPDLTGRENVYFCGALLGMRRQEIARKFDEIVAFAEVERFVDVPVKRYSSGMYVRLGFAVAAYLEPEILLVDEVLAVGDFAFQRKCLGRMRAHASEGRTVLFVSHNLSAIRQLCHRCIQLDAGRIVAEGPSDQVVDGYLASMRSSTASEAHQDQSCEDDDGAGFVLRVAQGREMVVTCGDRIELALEIEAPSPLDPDTGVAITIDGAGGTPIVNMRTRGPLIDHGSPASRRWRIVCDLGQLPLNAGSFHASVYLVGGARTIAMFSHAIHLRVLDHPSFGWGASLPSSRYWGPLYWQPAWRVEPCEDDPRREGGRDGRGERPVPIAASATREGVR
jgi:lipopolysaccharide transport system ATP-binding protein